MDDQASVPRAEDCVVAPLLERWARQRPQHPFLEFDAGAASFAHWDFATMLQRTRRAAAALRGLGLGRGERLLCLMPTRPETVLGWFAANWIGAVYVPVNTAWRGSLLQHAVALADARVLLVHATLLPRLLELDWPRLRAAHGVTLREVVVVGEAHVHLAQAQAAGLRLHAYALLEQAEGIDAEPQVEPWDANWILFTSGTTGASKAVLGTYLQAWSGGACAMDYFGADDRLLANLPLFHVSGAGAVMDRLIKGGTCVLLDGFSASAFWDVVRRHRISGCCLVGAMTPFLLKQPPDPRDREHGLRNVITVPWNADSLAVAERFGIAMHTAFNMTELATPLRSPPNPPRLGTCGLPRPGVEARVVDAHDLEVPDGTVGELVLRTSRPWEITAGYFRDAAATASAWRNGWFHTGDAFRRDADGWFYFVDRLKDSIRRRGENVSSFEVETEVLQHEAVREAAAIPVPSEYGEDEVMVVVALQPGQSLDPAALLRFLEPRMAHYMLPRYLRIVDELPKTPTAKVEKHRLRAAGVTADTWDREAHGLTVRGGHLTAAAEANALLQQLNSQAALLRLLAALAEHGIADQLAEGPRTAADLAQATQLDPAALQRVLRFVASCGFFSEDAAGRFSLTPLAAALRRDVPGSIRERLRLPWQDLLWRSYQHLPDTLVSGRNAFELAHGRPMFEYLADHPEVGAIFDRSMARVSQLENPLIARAWRFGAHDVVVDVGGGQGGLLAAVLREQPGVRGVLFDQPQVVAAPEALRDPQLAGRWQARGGDFFAEVPTGGDVYLLKRILHDWDDAQALSILRRCRAALSPVARLLIVDAVIAPGNDPDPNKFLDINMLTLNRGRERSAAEFRTLCEAAGLVIESLLPLPAPATLTMIVARGS